MNHVIRATMLGKFTLMQEGMDAPAVVSLAGRSRRLWTLVAYLVLQRERGVSTQELIDLLWPDAEGSNPASTLQNNVSRSRNSLAEMGFEQAKTLIRYENGYYKWAPEWETHLDIEEFESLAKRALDCREQQQALEWGLKAIELYTGDFLPEAATEFWCINLNAYYRSLYIRLCRETVQGLFRAGRLPELERICSRVIELDPAAEEFSVYLMRALIRNHSPQKALDHYEYIWQLYRETYGAAPSEALDAEKAAAVEALYGKDVEDDEIRDFLLKGNQEPGAFCCDNGTFREIISLQVRSMQRQKTDAQLTILRLNSQEADQEKRAIYMKQMETTLQKSLRSGDPFTRVGANQFWVLLPGASNENGKLVMDRVINRMHKDYPRTEAGFRVRVLDLEELNSRMAVGKNL